MLSETYPKEVERLKIGPAAFGTGKCLFQMLQNLLPHCLELGVKKSLSAVALHVRFREVDL
jgi:hypothetical protein